MLNNHIYHFKWSSSSVSDSGVDWMLSVIITNRNNWKQKIIIPLFEDKESELRTMDNKVTGED
jgi:hypothetical protein